MKLPCQDNLEDWGNDIGNYLPSFGIELFDDSNQKKLSGQVDHDHISEVMGEL